MACRACSRWTPAWTRSTPRPPSQLGEHDAGGGGEQPRGHGRRRLPVTATDADDDTLTYTLEGTDAASFQIVSASGQIQTKSGATYDYETKSSYSVTVKADDGNGGSDTIAVAIDLLDVDETVATPGAPQNVAATAGTGKVRLTWQAPESEGGAVTHYEYRRKEGSGSYGGWTTAETVAFGSNSNSAILVDATTLDDYDVKAETTYTYRVRAVNASGGGDASAEDSATTGAAMTVKVEVAEPEVFEDEGPVRVVVVAEMPATGPNTEKYDLEFTVKAFIHSGTASGLYDYDLFVKRPPCSRPMTSGWSPGAGSPRSRTRSRSSTTTYRRAGRDLRIRRRQICPSQPPLRHHPRRHGRP